MNKQYDFIAMGDIATDAFIRLETESAHFDIDHNVKEICMRFAEKIPYKDVYRIPGVGNSANVAVSASRLGLKSALVTNVGDDYYGGECRKVLENEGVGTDFVAVHENQKTNYHYVLWYEDDRTILIKHEEYEYRLPNIDSPKWLYLSSLGGNSFPFHEEIKNFLKTHSEVKLAFQPGTYQIRLGKEKLAYFYKRAEIFFCNKEEAQRILNVSDSDIKILLEKLHGLGLRIAVVTDGKKGAYTYDGSEMLFMPPYPDPKPPLERTGAGDAFSSTFTSALALGMSIKDALCWAPINSMSVVQYVGAREGLLTRAQIEEYLKKAPEDYWPKPI